MTTRPTQEPHPEREPASESNGRESSETALIKHAERWIREALEAWAEDDHAKVALLAPIAVELLGKATLWRENPVLLVPLQDRHENTLFLVATRPDLTMKGVRTIGLRIVLSRLLKLLGDLPVVGERRERVVDVRNGAVHVGTSEESRYVLLDCLAVMAMLLSRMGLARGAFFGEQANTVNALLDERKTEISRTVAARMTKARLRLTDSKGPSVRLPSRRRRSSWRTSAGRSIRRTSSRAALVSRSTAQSADQRHGCLETSR